MLPIFTYDIDTTLPKWDTDDDLWFMVNDHRSMRIRKVYPKEKTGLPFKKGVWALVHRKIGKDYNRLYLQLPGEIPNNEIVLVALKQELKHMKEHGETKISLAKLRIRSNALALKYFG